MPSIKLPYHHGYMDVDIPQNRLAGILESRAHRHGSEHSQETLVRNALNNPYQTPKLEELARGKKNSGGHYQRPHPSGAQQRHHAVAFGKIKGGKTRL